MRLMRMLKHLSAPSGMLHRNLSDGMLDAITAAIAQGETAHRGEIRIVLEGALPLSSLWRNESPRQRAANLFVSYGIGQTREASGILVYIQLLERRVEILGDQGIASHVTQHEWDSLCRSMEASFAKGDFKNGLLNAVDRMNILLTTHFPADAEDNPNELENRPLVI